MIKQDVLDLLSCPHCHQQLLQPSEVKLKCMDCEQEYPIEDGIIILMPPKK